MGVDHDMVTVTVRREGFEQTIAAIVTAHAEYCTMGRRCNCDAVAGRLEKVLEIAPIVKDAPRP